MIVTSPHLYRRGAPKDVSQDVVERALKQSKPPERLGLPAILTLGHFAHLTGSTYRYLREITARQRDPYRTFFIRKSNGGRRLIAVPEPQLAAIQRWIVDNVLLALPHHAASYAYHRGASPLECAKRHLAARWLVKADIHDFFESISERRIYFVFRDCGYQPLVSLELARLCTRISTGESAKLAQWRPERRSSGIPVYRRDVMGHLPQGAPTSPLLSNLASELLDKVLQRVAEKYDVTFTRYSDDLAFSTGALFTHSSAASLLIEIENVLGAFGHALHRKKTSISPPGARKVVLGLLVNDDRLRLTREYRSRIANHVRGVEKFGLATHAAHRHFASLWGMVRHINGLLAYADAVDPDFAAPLKKRLDQSLKAQSWPSTSGG